MKTKLYIARHGQTEASIKRIVQGRGINIPLVEEGKRQAEVLADGLKDHRFDLIFTSTAKRAIDTADIVRKHHENTPFENIFELNERSKGDAEGMGKDEFEKMYPEVIEKWNNEEDVRVAGGENYEDVEKRVVPIIENHLVDHGGKKLLYVLHGNVIRAMLGYMLGIPYNMRSRIKQDYCALNIASYDHERGRWNVETINKVFE